MSNHTCRDNEVFVFGSNLLGIHGAGAARTAHKEYGAEWGIGVGHEGNSYALPTCSRPGRALSEDEIALYVYDFITYAENRSDLKFFVTRVGCGIAGFKDEQIAPMFFEAPMNCRLPPEWEDMRKDAK